MNVRKNRGELFRWLIGILVVIIIGILTIRIAIKGYEADLRPLLEVPQKPEILIKNIYIDGKKCVLGDTLVVYKDKRTNPVVYIEMEEYCIIRNSSDNPAKISPPIRFFSEVVPDYTMFDKLSDGELETDINKWRKRHSLVNSIMPGENVRYPYPFRHNYYFDPLYSDPLFVAQRIHLYKNSKRVLYCLCYQAHYEFIPFKSQEIVISKEGDGKRKFVYYDFRLNHSLRLNYRPTFIQEEFKGRKKRKIENRLKEDGGFELFLKE
jgi:hypothetical protein